MATSKEALETAQQWFEILKDDWGRLPNTFKFCYVSGLSLIAATWLVRPGGHLPQFTLFNQQYNISVQEFSFLIFLLLLLGLPLLFWSGAMLKIIFYRLRYPLKKLGVEGGFVFHDVGGKVFLLDTKRKKAYWVESSKTAYDLGYYPSIWTDLIQRSKTAQLAKDGKGAINIDDYTLGRGIRTRGEPGK